MQHVKGKRCQKEKKNVKIQKNLTGIQGSRSLDSLRSLEMTGREVSFEMTKRRAAVEMTIVVSSCHVELVGIFAVRRMLYNIREGRLLAKCPSLQKFIVLLESSDSFIFGLRSRRMQMSLGIQHFRNLP